MKPKAILIKPKELKFGHNSDFSNDDGDFPLKTGHFTPQDPNLCSLLRPESPTSGTGDHL
jgi:hypothetical protein